MSNSMQGLAQPEDRFSLTGADDQAAGTDRPAVLGTVGDRPNGSGKLEETELDSALQLLVERAQYITGATGTALALPQGEEMVCRASAGASAPAVGARLQVRSGLTGESIARRQLLRCDNAESDPRVNLEACRALGIASIVVLPLLRQNGEVRGLFELFSDHPYAFEERDLIALERMADLTLTALDLAEQRQSSATALAPAPPARREPDPVVESAIANITTPIPAISVPAEVVEAAVVSAAPVVILQSVAGVAATEPEAVLAPVPEAMLRVQKCVSCGFPVSEGRSLCLDCEKKEIGKKDFEQKQSATEQNDVAESGTESAVPIQEEFVPAFLANAAPVRESWMTNHVNLLAIAVLILGILVAVVVFR
jgi:putative methionine-R-sulfoxide reductase with GAF domain